MRDPASIARALEQVTESLGPIEVLQYSPLPQKDFMRPVLESFPVMSRKTPTCLQVTSGTCTCGVTAFVSR